MLIYFAYITDECMVHAHMFGDDNDVDKTVRKAPNNARNYSVERKEGDDQRK